MKTKLQSIWESIHTSFWFFPTVISVVAIGLYAYPGGPEGARLMLSTIAGSTITVAGVTFSITIAALTMASSQFGPRLLRNFMADKGNQIVLGMFVGTFIYCLIVLRTVQDNTNGFFVPELAVTLAIFLALASFGVLIYFFHHASSSIQAEQVVGTIYRELITEIDHTFPEESENQSGPAESQGPDGSEGLPRECTFSVSAEESGYLRAMDVESLLSLASDRDLVIRLAYRPGDFVFEQTPLAWIGPKENADRRVHRKVRRAFVLGTYRSLEQDVEFPVQQLVDMALRALSPSLNDPYTAVNCIDRLGAAICHLSGRQSPPARRYDKAGHLRLSLDVHTYEGIVDAAFNQIRQSAQRSPGVSIRLLETLQAIAVATRRLDRREAIRRHAEMIYRTAGKA